MGLDCRWVKLFFFLYNSNWPFSKCSILNVTDQNYQNNFRCCPHYTSLISKVYKNAFCERALEKDFKICFVCIQFVFALDSCVNLADNYETIFHPVTPGGVPYPSHLKHFEIKMFTFVQNDAMLQDQVFIYFLRSGCALGCITETTSLPRFMYTVMLCSVMSIKMMESVRDCVHLPFL